jgi:hypothetical protein
MKLFPYHPRLIELLREHPAPGRGHAWLFRVALHIRHYHTEQAAFKFLREITSLWSDRSVPDSEIWKAVRKAYASATNAGSANTAAPEWSEPDTTAVARVIATTDPLFTIEPVRMDAQDVLSALFAAEDLVCVGRTMTIGETVPLVSILARAQSYQFIVPNPMTAREGKTQEGVATFRSLSNTAPREFLVIESDSIAKEFQPRILSHLARILPLILVVDSAGKSLHGWFACRFVTEAHLRVFMDYAIRLGADAHTWTACQWVRMPGGTRYGKESAVSQQILFFHPPRRQEQP